MKKVLFLLSFCVAFGFTAANAQSCSSASAAKSCCANKAAKAAAADVNIEKRQADDGTVAYVRKEADAQGNVKFVSVQYDEASNTFVNVAPKTMPAEAQATMPKKSCAAGASAGKACCSSGASADKKACCAAKTSNATGSTNHQ